MEEERARKILEEGAEVYSEGMMRGFSEWVNESSRNGDTEFLSHYLRSVSDANSGGGSSRLLSINLDFQERVFSTYRSSR